MANPNINIQDGFLFQSLKENREVAVALTSGKFFKGTIKRFARFAVIFLTSGQEILVYKHGIISIGDIPGAPPRTTSWSPGVRRPPVGITRATGRANDRGRWAGE